MTDFLTRLETELRDAHGRRPVRGPARRAVDAAPRMLAPALATVAALACGAVLAIALAGGEDADAPAGMASRPLQTLPASAQATPIAILNATTTPGLARRVANLLAKAGADIVRISDAANPRTGQTSVLYAPGHRAEATAVAGVLANAPIPRGPSAHVPPHAVIVPPAPWTITATTPRAVTVTTPRTIVSTTPAPLRHVAPDSLRPLLQISLHVAPIDATTRALAGAQAQVVVVAGNATAALLDRPATTVLGHYERTTIYPPVTPAVTREGCPTNALPLGRFGARMAGLAVREAWHLKDLPKLRSSVPAAKSDRAAQVRHACGQTAVERSAVVELDLVARHPSASLSQVVVFASRTKQGWRIWQRAH